MLLKYKMMKGLTFTYDIAIASIMILMLVILIYSNTFSTSPNYDVYNLLLLAEDAARVYANSNNCSMVHNILGNYKYKVIYNDRHVCGNQSLGEEIGVVVTLPVSKQTKNIIDKEPMYYYKSCRNTDQNGDPVYRCRVYSNQRLDDILNRYDDYLLYGYVKVIVSR